MLYIPFWFYRYFRQQFDSYIGGDLVQSVGWGEKLVRALAPAEIHAIYGYFIQLKSNNTTNEHLRKRLNPGLHLSSRPLRWGTRTGE